MQFIAGVPVTFCSFCPRSQQLKFQLDGNFQQWLLLTTLGWAERCTFILILIDLKLWSFFPFVHSFPTSSCCVCANMTVILVVLKNRSAAVLVMVGFGATQLTQPAGELCHYDHRNSSRGSQFRADVVEKSAVGNTLHSWPAVVWLD